MSENQNSSRQNIVTVSAGSGCLEVAIWPTSMMRQRLHLGGTILQLRQTVADGVLATSQWGTVW
jgi:hypothetical protein